MDRKIQETGKREIEAAYKNNPIAGRARDLTMGVWDSLKTAIPRALLGTLKAMDDFANYAAYKSLQSQGTLPANVVNEPSETSQALAGALRESVQGSAAWIF